MVKIAVAGGSGGKTHRIIPFIDVDLDPHCSELAREILDALIATKKHEITILSRNVGVVIISKVIHLLIPPKVPK